MNQRARHERRHLMGLTGLLEVAERRWDCVTRDVSYSGVSMLLDHLDSPPPLGTFAHLALALPRGWISRAPASVVHVTAVRHVTTIGLRFYGFSGPEFRVWERFIEEQATGQPGPSTEALLAAETLPLAQRFDTFMMRNAYQVTVLRVYATSVSGLLTILDRGTMFIRTDEKLQVGNEVGIQFVHPNSDDLFESAAFVTRVVAQHGVQGVAVEFLDLDDDRAQRFREFVEDGLASLFDDETVEP